MKLAPLNNFRELPRAIAEASQKPSTFVVYEEDDMVSCIWRILSDNRPRTAGEIAHLLRDTEWKVAAISMAMRRLANEGSFEVILAANKNLNAYKIKKGMEMTVDTTNKKPRKFEPTTQHVHSGHGVIRAEEGIDVCIWKATADRKSRLIDEISDILFQYGLNRVVVKDRVIYLANAKKWFDRQGKSKSTRYSLKKGVSIPAFAPLQVEEVASAALSAGTVHPRNENFVPPVAALPETKANVEVESESIPVTHTFNKADGIHVNIWKAMSDYREYTATDVGILLELVGFNPKTVGVQIGELWKKKNWFERRPVEGTKSYAYTLRREIEMPPAPVARIVPAETEQPELPLETKSEVQSETEPQPKEESMAQAEILEAPLFDFTLKLKGIPFDLNEARALAAELEKIDFTPEDNSEAEPAEPALLESTYRIKGVEFTRSQLRIVKMKLNNIGLNANR